jgi:hypothetical protein
LREVGQKLQAVLSEARAGSQGGKSQTIRLVAYVKQILDRLPQSFERRFHFDSALLSGIVADWGKQSQLSGMIVPRHESEWGHERIVMPSEDINSAHVIDLILMPKSDRLEDIDLLAYPFIIHELNHYLLLRYESLFNPIFMAALNKTAATMRLGAISDRGSARTKAHSRIDELLRFWTPRPDQKDWGHEVAIDVVSLWMCGPAYLACFQDVVDAPKDPYTITRTHPPYAVRAEALIKAAQEIGLDRYSTALKNALERWLSSPWKRKRDNRYLALTRPDLVEACTKTAIDFCKSMTIEPCTRRRVQDLEASLDNLKADEIGIDTLIYAWLKFERDGEVAYTGWESQLIEDITTRIMS